MIKGLITFISLKILSPFKWTFLKYFFTGRVYDITPMEREYARALMKDGLYLWVSRRDSHLTTYLISLGDFILSLRSWLARGQTGPGPRWGYWSHAFFNCDDNEIVEAIAKGVQRHFFDSVFDCDSIAALVPSKMTVGEWEEIRPLLSDEMLRHLGKKYDSVFDISNDDMVSCIELIRVVLKNKVEHYDLKFANFESMIKQYKNVTPQMLYESEDFKVVWEARG